MGYELGRHVGPRILAWPWFHQRFGDKVERASAHLQASGGRAVLLGRWTSLLRALVPGLAGMARMPNRRFLVFNVVGGAPWATTFVLLGYLAGASWRTVERVAGRASLVLLALVVAGFVVRGTTRRLVANVDLVRARLDQVSASPAARLVLDRVGRPLAWIRQRATPGSSRGLGWTLSMLVATAATWIVGAAVQDLFAREELILLDRPLASWIAAHTTSQAVAVADTTARLLGPPAGVWLPTALAAAVWRVRSADDGLRVVVAALLAAAAAVGMAAVLPVSPTGTRFPAVTVTWLTAAFVTAVAAWGPGDLRAAIRLGGLGTLVLLVAAIAELVDGRATLSGIVGAVGLGALIAMGGELTHRTLARSPAPGGVIPTG